MKTCFYDILVTYLDLLSRPEGLDLVDTNEMRPGENRTSTDCVARTNSRELHITGNFLYVNKPIPVWMHCSYLHLPVHIDADWNLT